MPGGQVEPGGGVGADGPGQPGREVGVDVFDHDALVGVVQDHVGQRVVGGDVRGPQRPNPVVVLDHQVQRLVAVGRGSRGTSAREPAQELPALLGGLLVVGTGPPRGGRCGAGEVQRELRNDSGRIMRALDEGASFVINRNGQPVGELRPLRRRRFVDAAAAVEMFRGAPRVDAAALRRDLDEAVDQSIPDRV